MNIEEMYVPTGLKTVDGKDIMGFNGAFYLQNKEKINKMLKKYADIVYKIKNKNAFILIEHQSSVDLKMAYRIRCYKNAIIEESVDKKKLREKNYRIPKVIAIVLYTGRREWQNLLISDIEEKIEEYIEPENEYTPVDSNKFSREELLEDTLMTSKTMLIEKSKNTEELYQNIEDVIENQKEKNALNNIQLEKLVQYELTETKDEKMIKDFIEKIRNAKGENEIMTNASRIINREIRKQRKEGREEGIALIAKRLKEEMNIKDISRITGLSEAEIENL